MELWRALVLTGALAGGTILATYVVTRLFNRPSPELEAQKALLNTEVRQHLGPR